VVVITVGSQAGLVFAFFEFYNKFVFYIWPVLVQWKSAVFKTFPALLHLCNCV